MRQGNTYKSEGFFSRGCWRQWENKRILFLICLPCVQEKWDREGRERESGRVWQRKFGVQCATEISAAAERTCGSLFLYYIFPRRTFWFEREREFSDAAAIFSLHDTRARWIAFKDSYIQGQRSSGRTPHFFSLYCLLVGRKKKKKRTWCVLCMPQNPAGTYLELCYHLFWLDSLFLSDVYSA